MQKTFLFLFSFLFFITLSAQQNLLSNEAEISVLTISPGNSLYEAFGHSAYRIFDRKNKIDDVYDYGVFYFNTPNFYLKFAQGKLNYSIGKNDFYQFYQTYVHYNRKIKYQVLNLSQSQKQTLYNFLLNNYKPENRNYLYEFFFDNCATKIKDVTTIAVNKTIEFKLPKNYKEKTFRSLIYENVNKNSWESLGIDVALGSVIDKKATPEEQMFLPENIYQFFEVATINDGNTPLVKTSKTLFTQKETIKKDSFFTSPLFVFGIIAFFIIFITYKDYKSNRQSKWLDITLFSITGLVGILILLLWFATDHTGTHQNYNLLWACAINLFVIGQFFKKRISIWFIKYLKLLVILLCLLTLHWSMGVQVFAIGLIPLLIALFIRYIFLIKHYNKQ
ncbi:lipoprotein N-acyltransferase Lnb domain-containing protein [Thalassobellus citreus]|uniref:lipoprotein N-acyltransferase Lnb domain-containing protein n=1 Tax=Thalassobellus citreus TaxID=3367752 RepID=UPI003790E959